jgi:hypothetical protein
MGKKHKRKNEIEYWNPSIMIIPEENVICA